MKKTIEKTFDCVEFKHQAQRKIFRETRGKTVLEQAAYFRKKVSRGPLAGWWSTIQPGTTAGTRKRASA